MIKNLFVSLKEIFIVMLVQYFILILSDLFFGKDRVIIIGTIILSIFELIYIFIKIKNIKIEIKRMIYFPYILLGISISLIYNMLLFRFNLQNTNIVSIPIYLDIISSCVIGPIFEELLFRYSYINSLSRFCKNKLVIILISSFIFAILHSNIMTIIYAFIIGIINSYLYLKKKDILIPIIVHMSANIITTFLFSYNSYILILGIILFIISTISNIKFSYKE